ncbi:MAG: glycoside hydrolase [Planctomycetes bacterium]|nr:glycoside hydrolase [Planctomycetota bacterium]
MHLTSKTVLCETPGSGSSVYAETFYNTHAGVAKTLRRSIETRSDLFDSTEEAFSADNGKTWSPFEQRRIVDRTDKGMYRLTIMPGWVDPVNGRFLNMLVEGILPADDALADGMRNYYLRYRVSLDGGRTFSVDNPCIQHGPPEKFDAAHPFEGVTVGKNSMMLGDRGSETIRTRGGRVLVPAQVCPVGPDGEYINPGGGYTYHDAAVLIGKWNDESAGAKDLRITWGLSSYIKGDPTRSTRGCVEPTLAQFPDGRILMILRGSNGGSKDPDHAIPSYRWCTVSRDEGSTWAPVEPWTFDDGTPFYSPSSMSMLLRHSNGNVYWIGNISPINCRANSPRYPIVIGRVEPTGLRLIRDSIFVIDDKKPDESPSMMLSNFYAHEDRITGEIIVNMSRFMLPDWIANAYEYRVQP